MTPKKNKNANGPLSDELVDKLLEGYTKPEDLVGKDGILKQLTGRLVERVLDAELTAHLGYEKHDAAGDGSGNSRNGGRKKKLITDRGPVEIEAPRDRGGSFEPGLVKKGQRRFNGFDDVILSLYSHGMTVREIQGHLSEMYGTEISPGLISGATAAVADDVKAWRSRPLEAVYAIVYLDAIVIKVRDEGAVQTCVVHMIRNSLRYVGYKERKEVASDLKPIYRAIDRAGAEAALDAFDEKWGTKFPMITAGWRARWEQFTSFLDFPAELRKVIYTTNQVEAVNSSLRRLVRG